MYTNSHILHIWHMYIRNSLRLNEINGDKHHARARDRFILGRELQYIVVLFTGNAHVTISVKHLSLINSN